MNSTQGKNMKWKLFCESCSQNSLLMLYSGCIAQKTSAHREKRKTLCRENLFSIIKRTAIFVTFFALFSLRSYHKESIKCPSFNLPFLEISFIDKQ